MAQTQTVSLVLMVVIVNRGKGEKLAQSFLNDSATFNLLSLARGTADKKLLSYLGLGETEKEVLYSAMPYESSRTILNKLNGQLNFKKPGRGIAFCVPINDIANAASKKRLQSAGPEQGGEVPMEQSYEYDLIVAITSHGYADDVMDAARSAGAPGGTILRARGAGIQQAEKFFGLSIQPEKDMLLILAKKDIRQEIMKAITGKKELQIDARAVVFSLPVNGVAGLSFDN